MHFIAKSAALATVSFAALLSACSAPTSSEPAQATESLDVAHAAITVSASYAFAYVGTPTYGYEPRAAFLTVNALVDDALVVAEHPAFDGLERAFVLVPRASGGATTWQRIELDYRGPAFSGYYLQQRRDAHEVSGLRLSDADLALVTTLGVAVGIETNAGTAWAQEPNRNVVPKEATR